ncbi:class I SAM-dependent methyltransferase [Candidatus Woesearchaeota archaeon]|nr:class I SAM-dependent methyltransferase [Candidatus Woesearchaeota archaeon]
MNSKDIISKVKKAYDIIARLHKTKVKSAEHDHRFIEKFLALLEPNQNVLDIGAGTGELSHEMGTKHLLKVTAIDLSKKMVKIAKEHYPDLNIQLMNITNLKFPPKSFDAVFANYSLIHIPEQDIVKVLKQIHKVLKFKGYVYFSLQKPTSKKQKDGFYDVVYQKQVKLFINLINENEIRKYLNKAKFKVLWTGLRESDKKTEFPFDKLFVAARKM